MSAGHAMDYRRQEIRPFEAHPALVFWETTRACALACRHCRAEAQPDPLPGELTTSQGRALIEAVAAFDRPRPVLVCTGGDVMMRPDLFELIAYARSLGLMVAVSPSATPRLTRVAFARFQELGVHGLSVSMDATGMAHDRLRGVVGTYSRSIQALQGAKAADLHPQVNTVVMRSTAHQLADVAAMLLREGVSTWEVFFLVATGRALQNEYLDRSEVSDVTRFLLEVTRYGITVRTVEAPFIRRMLLEVESREVTVGPLYRFLIDRLLSLVGSVTTSGAMKLARSGTLDGDGIVFVAYDGIIYPGGLLPVALGNVTGDDLVRLYRTHPMLRAIRARTFGGPCGVCLYRDVCGGSRARAYAETGDPLGTDPLCPWLRAEAVAK